MPSGPSPRISDHFLRLADPRRGRTTHPLINLVTIAPCATVAGADDFVTMIAWARRHQPWPARYLDLSRGIPSHDCPNMPFRRLKPEVFERGLLSRLAALHDTRGGTLVAIDGETLRRSFDKATSRSALHLVSARAVSQRLSPGSVAVQEESNEIAAIRELIERIELSGAIVTIDAMGCQAEIAGAIVTGGGDSILAVRGNQPTPHGGIVGHFLDPTDDDFARVAVSRHETKGEGHGRQEHRTYYVLDVPGGPADAGRRAGLAQIGMAISRTMRGGKPCDDVRYSILGRRLSARRSGTLVRGHRGIENSLHWQLDVSLGEDQSRTRKDHAATTLGGLRRTALSLLKNETSEKVGVKTRRLIAGWSTDHLRKVLSGA